MKELILMLALPACGLMTLCSQAMGQEKQGVPCPQEVYTGTIVNIGGRSMQIGFTLKVEAKTSNEEAMRYVGVLADNGQEALLKLVRKNNLGYIAATGQTRRDLLVVRDAQIEGKRRLIVAFERWLGFYEVRAGTRTLDYPWAIMEIYFDEKGKGTGTFIGLAQVKLVRDKKTGQVRLELENFGSFPEKVMGVMRRND
ncbi:MAG: hypothetical protein ACREDR_04340 [Blastocatellia bacterium]